MNSKYVPDDCPLSIFYADQQAKHIGIAANWDGYTSPYICIMI